MMMLTALRRLDARLDRLIGCDTEAVDAIVTELEEMERELGIAPASSIHGSIDYDEERIDEIIQRLANVQLAIRRLALKHNSV